MIYIYHNNKKMVREVILSPGITVVAWILPQIQDVHTLIPSIIPLYIILFDKKNFVDGLSLQILR